MPLTDLELTAAAATISDAAMDAAATSSTSVLEEAAICERAGQQLVARATSIRQNETKLAITFAEKQTTLFAEHRAAEAAKAAQEKANLEAIEKSNAKVRK